MMEFRKNSATRFRPGKSVYRDTGKNRLFRRNNSAENINDGSDKTKTFEWTEVENI